eukprot:UN02029
MNTVQKKPTKHHSLKDLMKPNKTHNTFENITQQQTNKTENITQQQIPNEPVKIKSQDKIINSSRVKTGDQAEPNRKKKPSQTDILIKTQEKNITTSGYNENTGRKTKTKEKDTSRC